MDFLAGLVPTLIWAIVILFCAIALTGMADRILSTFRDLKMFELFLRAVDQGVMTRNEVRRAVGQTTVTDGDLLTVIDPCATLSEMLKGPAIVQRNESSPFGITTDERIL